MATISKKDMGARAAISAQLTPSIDDRLRHARELGAAHPVDEVTVRSVVPVGDLVVPSETYVVGQVYAVPLARVRESRMNARAFYPTDEVDSMAVSLSEHGQEVPALGYVEDGFDGFLTLIDGQKRLRGAKAAGLPFLRIDVCLAPLDEKSVFLSSRRINRERSSQTALDDAVRFQDLLGRQIFQNQQMLGDELGMSQTMVSRTIALNAIPEALMRRMKDYAQLTGIVAAHAISQIFTSEKFRDQPEVAMELGSSIIDEVIKKEISGNQIKSLVDSRIEGPRTRVRNESRYVVYGGVRGVIKTNVEKGLLDFSITGLSAEKVEALRRKIESGLEDQAAK